MNANVEEVQAIRDLFDEHFEEWADDNLIQILDETFDEWRLRTDSKDGTFLVHAKLNDVEEYGEDLDALLESQVLGIKFLDSLGLKPSTGYNMGSFLKVLSDYILVYSLNE